MARADTVRAELRALGVPVEVALIAPGPVDTPFWRHARTTDSRLPPQIGGAYRAEDVAAEVVHALHRPRAERTVGGLMAAWVVCDAVAPRDVEGGLLARPSVLRKLRDRTLSS